MVEMTSGPGWSCWAGTRYRMLDLDLWGLDHGEESIDGTESIDASVSESVVGPRGVIDTLADLSRELEVAVGIVLEDVYNSVVGHVGVASSQETNKTSGVGASHGSSGHGGESGVAGVSSRTDLVTWSGNQRLLASTNVGWTTGAEGSDGVSGGGGSNSNDVSSVSGRQGSTARWAGVS